MDRNDKVLLGLAGARPTNITARRAARTMAWLEREAEAARVCPVCLTRPRGPAWAGPACAAEECRAVILRIDRAAGMSGRARWPVIRRTILDAQDMEFRCEVTDPEVRPIRWSRVTVSLEGLA